MMNDKKMKWYSQHNCYFRLDGYALMSKQRDENDWVMIDLDHCISEGENHYEIYKYFGEEQWYVDYLFDFLQDEIYYQRTEIPIQG